MKRALLLALVLLSALPICAQSIGVGYYDVDGLYDTIPSRFYDDSNYTPVGRYSWNSERYNHKIKQIATVVDTLALPVVALFGVENEGVVRDLVTQCRQDYTYLHRTRNSFDGMDFALLYFGDRIFIDKVTPQRDMLIVEASLPCDTHITIILSRNGDDTIDYLRDNSLSDSSFVVLGPVSRRAVAQFKCADAMRAREQLGEGNYSVGSDGWIMRDRIAVSLDLKIIKSGVYITPWLLNPDRHSPFPTFGGNNYLGGFSKYLPIFAYISL